MCIIWDNNYAHYWKCYVVVTIIMIHLELANDHASQSKLVRLCTVHKNSDGCHRKIPVGPVAWISMEITVCT